MTIVVSRLAPGEDDWIVARQGVSTWGVANEISSHKTLSAAKAAANRAAKKGEKVKVKGGRSGGSSGGGGGGLFSTLASAGKSAGKKAVDTAKELDRQMVESHGRDSPDSGTSRGGRTQNDREDPFSIGLGESSLEEAGGDGRDPFVPGGGGEFGFPGNDGDDKDPYVPEELF